MIIAHGVDLVDIASFEKLLAEPTGDFLGRCFSPEEQAVVGQGPHRSARLAGRFAVKEAVMKALGTGFGEGVGFLDIEVRTTAAGAPSIALYRTAAARAQQLGVTRWLVSTSHDGGFAIGSVIALAD